MARLLRPALALAIPCCLASVSAVVSPGDELLEAVRHGYADNDGVRIHYAALGERGPLVVMIHGFPDYWYTWRHQMAALAEDHRVVAIDLRGYNLSDRPEGLDAYRFPVLMQDVVAVIRHLGEERAVIVGHDWGGAIAWSLAIWRPDVVERLIVCNIPHPNGLVRELRNNPEQRSASEYLFDYDAPDAEANMSLEWLTSWNTDEEALPHYREALARSDRTAMLNYYRANFPRPASPGSTTAGSASPRSGAAGPPPAPPPKIRAPVLVIFGLEDTALSPAGLDGTWDWIDAEMTLLTIPGAGHFVQQDARERVTEAMVSWLGRGGG